MYTSLYMLQRGRLFRATQYSEQSAENQESMESSQRGLRGCEAAREYCASVALDALEGEEKQKDAVQISTIHRSKGREFKYVFLIRFNEGMLPGAPRPPAIEIPNVIYTKTPGVAEKMKRTPVWPTSREIEQHLAEERRLAHVAITRAKKRMHLLYLGGNRKGRVKLIFIQQTPPCLLG